MPTDRHFVGRDAERARFRELLDDPVGRAVLIVGPEKMGKSFLARRMLEEAEGHPTLTCGTVSYQVAATDPPEQVMERMIEDAFAAGGAEGSLSASPHRRRQWRTLFRTVVPKGKDLLDLADSLRRATTRPARERLVELFGKLSDTLPDDRRVLFLVDAEKHLPEGSDEPWAWVIRQLPPRIVLLFTQRPDDTLAVSSEIDRLEQPERVVRISEDELGGLTSTDVDRLLRLVPAELGHSFEDLRSHFARLDGHPDAVGATLDLLIEGAPLDHLPADPGGLAAERRRRDEDRLGPLLTTGAADLPPDPPPSKLLTARYEVIPFEEAGRERELAVLDAWCRDPEPGSVVLLHGEGGTGKTRLLIEWCRRLRERGWHDGFLDRDADRSDLEPIFQGEAPRLAVIDYGETRPDLVAPALHRLARQRATGGPRARIVLLARTAGAWWNQLQEDDRLIEDLALRSPKPIALTPLIPAIEGRAATVARAVEKFAAFFDQEPSAPGEATDYTDPRYDRILYLHVDALLQVIGRDDEDDPPLARILSRERATWRRALVAQGMATASVPDRLRRAADRAMTAPTLIRGVQTRAEACNVIQAAVPNADGATVEDLADLLHRLYPSPPGPDARWIGPLEPDVLGEELVRQVLTADLRLLDRLLDAADDRGAQGALVVVGRLLDDEAPPPGLAQWIDQRIGGENHLPVSLRETAEAATRLVLDQHREDHPEPDEEALQERSRLFNNLSNRLADLGRREEALSAIEESVEIARGLAASNPEAFRADLARSLNNLSNRLAFVGRREEAVSAIKESVSIRRDLFRVHPEAFAVDLAGSLNNLSLHLADVGRHEEALIVMKEAIGVYRDLPASACPDGFVHDLAGSLDNLSLSWRRLGRREEALAATEEAVLLLRDLAGAHPDVFNSVLARSLHNLSIHLAELDRREEALAAIEEAVSLRRHLVRDHGEAFLPDLAVSLNTLSNRLGVLDRSEEALYTMEEAVTLYRGLARVWPESFCPSLAQSLNNLSAHLASHGRREEALDAVREAVSIRRGLAGARPEVFGQDLAQSLHNLSVHQTALGRHAEGLSAIEEAVELYRDLAAARPEAFGPELAGSLNILSVCLASVGRHDEALGESKEALRILAPHFLRLPRAFVSRMRMMLGVYAKRCKETEKELDGKLVGPILEALARLDEEGGSEG